MPRDSRLHPNDVRISEKMGGGPMPRGRGRGNPAFRGSGAPGGSPRPPWMDRGGHQRQMPMGNFQPTSPGSNLGPREYIVTRATVKLKADIVLCTVFRISIGYRHVVAYTIIFFQVARVNHDDVDARSSSSRFHELTTSMIREKPKESRSVAVAAAAAVKASSRKFSRRSSSSSSCSSKARIIHESREIDRCLFAVCHREHAAAAVAEASRRP
ncbi:unnamed protein product [Trichogramma brassicae]|uniref:Uncharacterized protein n=1 Tax=Trichogramma brassicae TaxID=86971 RepID=A0A6H5IQ22_9HYME|nr:unnamed protein product [Trichogramma brassicae]